MQTFFFFVNPFHKLIVGIRNTPEIHKFECQCHKKGQQTINDVLQANLARSAKKIDAKRMRYDLREIEHRITDFYRKHKQMADSPEIDFCLLDNQLQWS